MKMILPTDAEIAAAYDRITEDGHESEQGYPLSTRIIDDPLMNEVISRMARHVVHFLGLPVDKEVIAHVKGLLGGALVYGVHLGIHIGEARSYEKVSHLETEIESTKRKPDASPVDV